MEVVLQRLFDECESGSALQCAGGYHGEETLAGDVSPQASGSLADTAIDDDEADGLLGTVVRWINAGSRDEGEVLLSVFAKAFRNIACLTAGRHIAGRGFDHGHFVFLKLCHEGIRAHGIALMNGMKQIAQGIENFGSVALQGRVVGIDKEFDVSDQVGKTELHNDVEVGHVLSVGGEIIAAPVLEKADS